MLTRRPLATAGMRSRTAVRLCLAIFATCSFGSAQAEELAFCGMQEQAGESMPPAAQVDVMIFFVAFPEDVGTGAELLDMPTINASVAGLEEFLDRQSRGAHSTNWQVLADPGHPERKWIATHNRSWYTQPASWFLDSARVESEVPFRDCLSTGVSGAQVYPVGASEGFGGHYLSVETLYTVYDALEPAPGISTPAELEGIDQFVFVYSGYPFQDQSIGGLAVLKARKGTLAAGPRVLSGPHENYPCLIWEPALTLGSVELGHITTVWKNGWDAARWEHIIAHEYGHDLRLGHPSLFSLIDGVDTNGEERYGYGNYSCMRGGEMKDEGFLPYHPWELLALGWYESSVLNTSVRDLRLDDVRDPLLGGLYHRVDLPSIVDDIPGHGVQTYPQFFLIGYHAGTYEDAELNAEASPRPIYRSKGLEIWHVIDRHSSAYKVAQRLDLEVATGRFLDPGTWEQPDATSGLADDSLDYWPARGEFWSEYGFYEGSAGDFFQLNPPAPFAASPEFSYRTNPNTFAYSEAWINTEQHLANSIFVEIKEEYTDHVVVDILLAPHEELLTPPPSATLAVGSPISVTWNNHRSFDFATPPTMVIDEVDIELSLDAGESWQPIATGLANNATPTTPGSYEWTPSIDQVSGECKLRLTFHNIYADPQQEIVGIDETDGIFYVAVAAFANQSSETGFDWPGEPFASVAADLDGGGDKDLLISDQREELAGWMEHQDNVPHPELPRFVDQTPVGNKFAPTELPTSLRGLTVADIDNDDDLDFFAAAAALPRLYRKVSGTYTYAAVPDASFPQALSTLAGNSWSASFGDFDRDGLVDLYIARATATGSGADDVPASALTDVLLRNTGDATFSNATSLGIDTSDPLATASATWADFDRDGNLDLLVGSFGSEDCKLYRNTLDAQGNRSFVLRSDLLPASTALHSVRSVHAADLDNDGDLDLMLGHGQMGQAGSLLLWNDGSGDFTSSTNVATSAAVAASAVLDHELDGALDLLLTADVESSTPSTPTLLHNQLQSPGSFSDLTASTGLSQPVSKRTTAIALADFGGSGGSDDGDLDLYLGRPSASDQFFYQATSAAGSDAPAGAWLRVRTRAAVPGGTGGIYLAGNNKDLIGSQVTVQQPSTGTPSWQQTQIVDGGSGYGSQAGFPLTFAIPYPTQSAKITLRAPDGAVVSKTIAANGYNLQTTIADTHNPGVVDASVSFSYEATEGPTTWTIKWIHALSAGFHEVAVFEGPGCDIVPGSSALLRNTTDGVTITSLPILGGYLVTAIWEGVDCIAPCTAQIQVRSYNGNTVSQSSLKTIQMPLCGEFEE